MLIEVKCVRCGRVYDVPVDKKEYEKWRNGELIQNAMPNLDTTNRELLISSLCGRCFDEICEDV